ncbi:hypothetical protein HMN09_01092600 [Mycena chlorophos]|uniref:Uncharacterized protein n=1 Tax=Mycena chlorophos TaxID=658473 RepID=A0A8H6VY86_MYCCL|nr:hypothetical protein HMN09_01092600 [Mycena chlorophos]
MLLDSAARLCFRALPPDRRGAPSHSGLDLVHSLTASVDSLDSALDAAATAVTDAGRLLSSIKVPEEEPKARARRSRTRTNAAFKEVVENVRTVSTDEVEYDSEHHFVNSLALCDTLVQTLTLLAVVCHITIGISARSCDFIVAIVGKMIRLAMGTASSNLQPNPKQEDILKQLPTSLEGALRRFKLDPKTVVYAVGIAFYQPWVEYDVATCHPDYRLKNPAKEIPQIRRLHLQLTQPVLPHDQTDEAMPPADSLAPIAITTEKLRGNLKLSKVSALRFVAHSLGIDLTGITGNLKKPYIDRLVSWRYMKPPYR